jgi:hypothetical protein
VGDIGLVALQDARAGAAPDAPDDELPDGTARLQLRGAGVEVGERPGELPLIRRRTYRITVSKHRPD